MPRRRSTAGSARKDAQAPALRARGQQTRQRLLDAGVHVFATRGYHAARVDDIVKGAETSHGTFYLYFANKEDLFRALAEDVAVEMRGLADALPPVTPDQAGYDALRSWLSSFADLYTHYGPVIRAWTEAEIGASEFGRLGTDVLTDFSRVLTGRIRRSSSPDVNPQIAALAVGAVIERLDYYLLSPQRDAGRDEMLDTPSTAPHS